MSIYFKDLEENAVKASILDDNAIAFCEKEEYELQEINLLKHTEENQDNPLVVVYSSEKLIDQETAGACLPTMSKIKTLQDQNEVHWQIISSTLQDYLSSEEESDITEALRHLQIEEPASSGSSGLITTRANEETSKRGEWQKGDFCQVDSSSDDEGAESIFKRVPPSGLTTVGPIKNLDIDPRDLIAQIDYGELEEVHEINVTDGVDMCCETKDNALRDNLGGGRKKKLGTLTGFARQAFTLPLRQLQDSRKFRLSMLKKRKPIFGFFRKKKTPKPYYTCEQATDEAAGGDETLPTTNSDPNICIRAAGTSELDNNAQEIVSDKKRARFMEEFWRNSKRILQAKPSTSGSQ